MSIEETPEEVPEALHTESRISSRYLSYEMTQKHMFRAYENAEKEIRDDGLEPDPYAISSFVLSLFVSDAIDRAVRGQTPWSIVLQHTCHQAYHVGEAMQNSNRMPPAARDMGDCSHDDSE